MQLNVAKDIRFKVVCSKCFIFLREQIKLAYQSVPNMDTVKECYMLSSINIVHLHWCAFENHQADRIGETIF